MIYHDDRSNKNLAREEKKYFFGCRLNFLFYSLHVISLPYTLYAEFETVLSQMFELLIKIKEM